MSAPRLDPFCGWRVPGGWSWGYVVWICLWFWLACYCLAWHASLVCDSRTTANRKFGGKARVKVVWGLKNWALEPGFGHAKAKLEWRLWLKPFPPFRYFFCNAHTLLFLVFVYSNKDFLVSLINMCMYFLFLGTSSKASTSDATGCHNTQDAGSWDSSLCRKQQRIPTKIACGK